MAITQKYLKNPDKFPGPDDGATWGDEELWINFVGGPYHVTGLGKIQHRRLAEHFAEACMSFPTRLDESVSVRVRCMVSTAFQPPAPPPREISFDLQAEQDHMKVAGDAMCGRIECADKTAGVLWTATAGEGMDVNAFVNFLRMLVAYRLRENGGLLLHSAAVVNGGKAYLFPGRSGNGKSSISRLSLEEGRTVLSDDMNAVTWHNEEPWVEKLPFTGDLGRTWTRGSSYPLRAILALQKSEQVFVRELSPVRATTLMTACAPYINADSNRLYSLLESLEKLTAIVPTHILGFSLKKGVWPVIQEAIQP